MEVVKSEKRKLIKVIALENHSYTTSANITNFLVVSY